MEELKCPICNENTAIFYGKPHKYNLCPYHSKQLKKGEIEIEEISGKRYFYGKQNFLQKVTGNENIIAVQKIEKTNKNNTVNEQKNSIIYIKNRNKCITCGNEVDGLHFCTACYYKYKDRSIDLRIKNCQEVEIIDQYGNKKIKTKDGRFVRSLSEKIILDYFFDHNIRVVYEKTIPYVNEKGESAELHPDFYLFDYDLYIEYNGLTNKSYLKKKDYANKIYQSKKYKVEILDANDIGDIEGTLGC